jgi:hypothetical protein
MGKNQDPGLTSRIRNTTNDTAKQDDTHLGPLEVVTGGLGVGGGGPTRPLHTGVAGQGRTQ